jgi:hypothetical protein
MSIYSMIEGSIVYESQEALDKALGFLRDRHWMNFDDQFINELGDVINGPMSKESNVEGLTLTIPFFYYRNLSCHIKELFVGGRGKVVWTSTNGDFQGGVETENGCKLYNLFDWAKENAEEPTYSNVHQMDKWMADVEQQFFEEFG